MPTIDKTNSAIPSFKNRANAKKATQLRRAALKRNDGVRKKEIEDLSKKDVKVNIPPAIKEFSRIKKAVEHAPDIDNTEKIAMLKEQIQKGKYQVDYEALAGKMLEQEF